MNKPKDERPPSDAGRVDPLVRQAVAEILSQWNAVQSDRASAREALENTGPGESPWHPATAEAWRMRELALGRTLVSAMPIIEELLLRL